MTPATMNAVVPTVVEVARGLSELGFGLVATRGTAAVLEGAAIPVRMVYKVKEGRPHIVDKIIDGDVTLIFNTTEGWQSLKDSQSIRGSALTGRVPYYTTAAASVAAAEAIAAMQNTSLEVRSLQDYYSN